MKCHLAELFQSRGMGSIFIMWNCVWGRSKLRSFTANFKKYTLNVLEHSEVASWLWRKDFLYDKALLFCGWIRGWTATTEVFHTTLLVENKTQLKRAIWLWKEIWIYSLLMWKSIGAHFIALMIRTHWCNYVYKSTIYHHRIQFYKSAETWQ